MHQEGSEKELERRDFFISYASSDEQWAEWIAKRLEDAGYTTFIQAWDFRPGMNFVAEMDRATKQANRTLLVLSPAYLRSEYAFAEWAVAFRKDPSGTSQCVLPVRIEPCDPGGLLGSLVFIDLVSLNEAQARDRLLSGVQQGPVKRTAVAFPQQRMPHTRAPFPASFPPVWMLPFARNPFFTGREDVLEQLRTHLQTTGTAAIGQPQAITGLGGIGKTQIAVEYAYRHRHDYQAVLWCLAESQEALTAGFVAIARALSLLEYQEQDQTITVQAVIKWLQTHQQWLLILDNVEDLQLLPPFLPSLNEGHIVLTTRAFATTSLARRIEVKELDDTPGAVLLLRRAGIVPADRGLEDASLEEQMVACALSKELGGLPLALDQAGAYTEETQCGLTNYQQRYQKQRAQLLARRGGVSDHPEPVATTWAISFEKVKQKSRLAAQMLQFCAFLAPDAIPEELVVQALISIAPSSGQANNGWLEGEGSPLNGLLNLLHDEKQEETSTEELSWKIDDAVAVLRAYSLIQRKTHEKMLSVHGLVQAVVRDGMQKWEYEVWTTCLVCALEALFPSAEFHTWELCARYLPQALACAEWMTQVDQRYPVGDSLLYRTGNYLLQRAQYQEAEPLLKRALAICERQLGKKHRDTGAILNTLGALYDAQGRYEEAEPLLKRALAICERKSEASHPNVASCLNNLAGVYKKQDRYLEAEPLLERARAICEQQLGKEHPGTATSLHNLAGLYKEQGRYLEAEPLLEQAVAISEQQLGKEHPDTARSLLDLGRLYYEQGKYAEAKPLLERARAICEQQLGKEHPDTARSLSNLATFYYWQGKYAEAESLYEDALAICEQHLGKEHSETATHQSNLARLYKDQGRYVEAEPLWKHALAVREQHFGREHPATMECLDDLARLYYTQGRYAEAEPFLKCSVAVSERALGRDHPRSQVRHRNYAILLQNMKSGEEQRKRQRLHKRFLM
jgi:tetratricopeptide (TPR) repeat protein